MCALEYLHKKNNKIFSILLSFLMLVLLFSATLFLRAQEVKEYDSNVGEILEFDAASQTNQVQPPAVIAPPAPPSSAVTEPAVVNTVPVVVPSREPSYPESVPARQSVPVQNSFNAPAQNQAQGYAPAQYPSASQTPPVYLPPVGPPPPVGSDRSLYAFHSYSLSYMQSDRVLALLKALGYSTVEFSVGRGESINESIFTQFQGGQHYPIIVKILDAAKTSLMQPAMDGGRNALGVDRLSGTYLHSSTTGAPEQRLLFIYEKQYPEQLNALLNLLRNEVDVAASQIVIEALVVEINTNKAKELGFSYTQVDKRSTTSFDDSGSLSSSFQSNQRGLFNWNPSRVTGTETTLGGYDVNGLAYGASTPLSGAFERINPLGFSATLKAFISDGTAEVLTNPTILVIDGRQALIRIGTQIPNTTIQTTAYGTQKSVNYIDTGIVLNIRPRISEDGSEVTMQTETIVSSAIYDASESSLKPEERTPPSIESKTIQSFVRVADNTPFIIGGLIDKKKTKGTTGVPFLSKIPVLGNLFKSNAESADDREVIIVLTPHIMDASEKSFSYVIPKDSQSFDSFDNLLFRNAYRIRDDDLFDLSFATQSDFYQNILKELRNFKRMHPEIPDDEPIFSYLDDKMPGEDVIVRRMIWEIVHKSKYHQHISDDHILLFEQNEDAKFGNKFKTHLLDLLLNRITENSQNSLVFNFADHRAKTVGPFEHPRALISMAQVSSGPTYIEQMNLLNSDDENRNTMLLCPSVSPPGVRGANALEVLKGVLVLKRILALNSTMPVTIDEFRVGRQIIFPTEQELKDKYHVIDYDVARFFYEVINYYPEFEQAFNRDSAAILYKIKGFGN
jgi:general secretion pathway protein D